MIGYAGAVWIALAPLLALWARRSPLWTTLVTAACVWTADVIVIAVKTVVSRPRPFDRLPGTDVLLSGTVGASFPSGHAATSFAGAVILGYLTRRALPWLAVLALLVSFSRVYVGVHYPADVVAGALVGAAVGALYGVLVRAKAPRSPSEGPPRSRGAPTRG
ncbi:MAG: phosphatase PAP2 family protein [Thermoleophilia bacterium]|nr:phosphatase PAP2 family protein [Thermoleophilia bacterium]